MCMVSLSRQVGELQGVVEELKSKACAKEVDLNLTARVAIVEEEQRQNARLIADFKLKLQQSEERAKLEANRCESLELELKGALQESQDLHRRLQVKSIIANFPEKAFSTFSSSSSSSSSQCYVFLTSKDVRRNEFHWRK
ncbi:unnamed protein product [Sphagnum troendelagicum]|uniref:Uncharacterized protein n=1 Tax=Sphagnum troendelagicum TaxID=128251 RepID=A0ABP0TJ70_9BRYO